MTLLARILLSALVPIAVGAGAVLYGMALRWQTMELQHQAQQAWANLVWRSDSLACCMCSAPWWVMTSRSMRAA